MDVKDDPSRRAGHLTDAERDPIQLTAADWVGRLSNVAVSMEETLEWQRWMNADARHADAFYRFEQISHTLKAMEPPPRPSRRQLERDAYDGSVPLSEWRKGLRRLERSGRTWLAVAATLVLSVATATWVILASGGRAASGQFASTGIGEHRTLDLADGSVITLGGNSRLEWSFTPTQRSLQLTQGEALFHVAHDVTRPFRVRAGDATVVAVGTAFNVRRASDHTVVVVTEGRVVIEPVTQLLPIALMREFKPKLRPVQLDAGEQTTAGSAGIDNALRTEDVAAATSWRSGRLSFRLQPLRYVLEDVNRYADKPIKAADAHVESLIVSGTVMEDNVAAWVASLERAFDLEAVEQSDQILLVVRQGNPAS